MAAALACEGASPGALSGDGTSRLGGASVICSLPDQGKESQVQTRLSCLSGVLSLALIILHPGIPVLTAASGGTRSPLAAP